VLWGAGGALRSGALEALVYEELVRLGAADAYARLIGRTQAIGWTASMVATGLATPVFAAGGYLVVGVVSVVTTLAGVPVGWSLPEARDRPHPRTESAARADGLSGGSEATEDATGDATEDAADDLAVTGVLREGLAEMWRTPLVRRTLLLVAVLTGITGALEEYVPLLALSTGVAAETVPLLELVVMAGFALGGWLAGRGTRWAAPALAVGAGCLAAGAVSDRPAGIALVAAAFGILQWATVTADARLQDRITDRARATVTSMAGFGSEVLAVLTYAGYALGSTWAAPGPLFALAVVPFLLMAALFRR
jgi:hypothetical protein